MRPVPGTGDNFFLIPGLPDHGRFARPEALAAQIPSPTTVITGLDPVIHAIAFQQAPAWEGPRQSSRRNERCTVMAWIAASSAAMTKGR
jgi:hypothetical protein